MVITQEMIKIDPPKIPTPEEISAECKTHTEEFLKFGLFLTPTAEEFLQSFSTAILNKGRKAKGVALFGNTGTGKSTLLKFAAFLLQCEYFTVPSLATIYAKDGEPFFWDAVSGRNTRSVVIDDLGAEQATRNFGNTLPIVELIYRRYDLFNNYPVRRLFVASNLTPTEMCDRYGERVVDRLQEMCICVVAAGESMREGVLK